MIKKLFSIAAALILLSSALQADTAFAISLSDEESAASGLYIRCPKDDAALCAQTKETVKKLYAADISPEDLEKQMAEYETLELLSASIADNPIASITLPGGNRLNLLTWSVKDASLTISGQELKNGKKFQIKDSILSGPDGVFIRVFTESELDDLATD